VRAAASLTDSADRLSQVTAAHWCADNQLASLRLAKQFPGVGDADFGCQQLGREYLGRMNTTVTPNPNFRLVSAAVLDDQGHVLARLFTVLGRY
jgi:general secretion pathway protein I